MTIQTLVLASDDEAAWRLVFAADEFDLYVQLVRCGIEPDPADRITIEDFLVTRPEDELHRKAVEALVAWICSAME